MADHTLQPDDELLSAYIDGELTADELRAVEQWIASDPAAQAMVEELRAVSKAVQSLPAAKVPADWTAQLQRRLDIVASGGPEGIAHAARSPSVGRSKRGWLWSAAAIAAAVAIMLLLPRDVENELAMREPEVPAPAAAPERDRALADRERGPRALSPAPDSDSSAARTELAEPEARLEELAASEPGIAAMDDAPDSNRDRSDFASIAPLIEGVSPEVASNTYLIVWADVPPESLRQQQINTLLGSNGIYVSTTTDEWGEAAEPVRQQIELRNRLNVDGLAAGDGSGRNSRPLLRNEGAGFARGTGEAEGESGAGDSSGANGADVGNASPQEPEGETILVEATMEQILACVADMQRDTSNFDSIVVEPVNERTLERQWQLQSAHSQAEGQADRFSSDQGETDAESASLSLDADFGQRSSSAESPAKSGDQVAAEAEGLAQQPVAETAPERGKALSKLGVLKEQAVESPQARRLARPAQWYFYNAPPTDAETGYQVREQSKVLTSKMRKGQREPTADKREQIEQLNRYVQQQVAGVAGDEVASGMAEEQPVQALFVLRNNKIVAPAAGETPASESASRPAGEGQGP